MVVFSRLIVAMIAFGLFVYSHAYGQVSIGESQGQPSGLASVLIDDTVVDGLLKIVTDHNDNTDIRLRAIDLLTSMSRQSDNTKATVVNSFLNVAQDKYGSAFASDALRIRQKAIEAIALLINIQSGDAIQSGGTITTVTTGTTGETPDANNAGQPARGGLSNGDPPQNNSPPQDSNIRQPSIDRGGE